MEGGSSARSHWAATAAVALVMVVGPSLALSDTGSHGSQSIARLPSASGSMLVRSIWRNQWSDVFDGATLRVVVGLPSPRLTAAFGAAMGEAYSLFCPGMVPEVNMSHMFGLHHAQPKRRRIIRNSISRSGSEIWVVKSPSIQSLPSVKSLHSDILLQEESCTPEEPLNSPSLVDMHEVITVRSIHGSPTFTEDLSESENVCNSIEDLSEGGLGVDQLVILEPSCNLSRKLSDDLHVIKEESECEEAEDPPNEEEEEAEEEVVPIKQLPYKDRLFSFRRTTRGGYSRRGLNRKRPLTLQPRVSVPWEWVAVIQDSSIAIHSIAYYRNCKWPKLIAWLHLNTNELRILRHQQILEFDILPVL